MPVTLATAKSSHASVRSSGSQLFNLVKNNTKFHDDSHWSREKASAALTSKSECSFYILTSPQQMLRHKAGIEPDQAFKVLPAKSKKKWESYTKMNNIAVTADRCLELVNTATQAINPIYKQSSKYPESRFLLIAPLPKNWSGITLIRNSPEVDCPYIVLVLIAGEGVNAAIVTHFPCSQAYVNGLVDLI